MRACLFIYYHLFYNGAAVTFGIESANVVGYQEVGAPSGFCESSGISVGLSRCSRCPIWCANATHTQNLAKSDPAHPLAGPSGAQGGAPRRFGRKICVCEASAYK